MKKNSPSLLFIYALLQLSANLVSGHSPENPVSETENLFLHTNLAGYHPGEPILFKAYISPEKPAQLSDSIYAVLLDKDGNEIAGDTIPVKNNIAYGKIVIPSSAEEGYYVLIASSGPPIKAVPSKMFSRILEIRSYEEPELSAEVKLMDTLYRPGSALTSNIRLTGKEGKAVQSTFSWELTGISGLISEGKIKTEANGKGSLKVNLPDFKAEDNLMLTVTASYKGTKKIIGVIIPTPFNTVPEPAGRPDYGNDILNIRINTLKKQYLLNENTEAEIIVTDGNGNNTAANLSVSCSNLAPGFSRIPAGDFPSYRTLEYKLLTLPSSQEESKGKAKKDTEGKGMPASGSIFTEPVRQSFTQYLLLATREPGNPFDASANKSSKSKRPPKKVGYSPDLSVLDIIMQIKPYWIANNRIIFYSSGITSVNNQDGAIIAIDGINQGTDIRVLTTVSVPDIALITASTSPMDIMKYTGMNSVGVIEIFTKQGPPEDTSNDPAKGRLTDSLLWQTDLSTDAAGKAKVSFRGNKSSEVVISVAGMTSDGLLGHKTVKIIYN
jgi:hypothetical protein